MSTDEEDYEFEEMDLEEESSSSSEVDKKLLDILRDVVKNEQTITQDELKKIFNEYVDATQINIDDLASAFKSKLESQPEKFDSILESLMAQIQAKLDKRAEEINFKAAEILTKLDGLENSKNSPENSHEQERFVIKKTGGFSFFVLFVLMISLCAGGFILERTYTRKIELDSRIKEGLKEAQAIETAIIMFKKTLETLKAK